MSEKCLSKQRPWRGSSRSVQQLLGSTGSFCQPTDGQAQQPPNQHSVLPSPQTPESSPSLTAAPPTHAPQCLGNPQRARAHLRFVYTSSCRLMLDLSTRKLKDIEGLCGHFRFWDWSEGSDLFLWLLGGLTAVLTERLKLLRKRERCSRGISNPEGQHSAPATTSSAIAICALTAGSVKAVCD